MRYYHGGYPGLRVGDRVLSPAEGGHEPTLAGYEEAFGGTSFDAERRKHVVFVTTERCIGQLFAAGFPNGALYVVQPEGPILRDPDTPESWAAPRATVLSVYDGLVSVDMMPKLIRRVMRMPRPAG